MSTDSNNSELKAADGTPKDEADDRIAAVQAPTNPSAAIDGPKEEEAEEDAAIVAQEQPPSPREIGAEEDASIVAQERPSSPKESGADATFPEQLWDLVEAESRDGINNAEGQRVIEWTENGEGIVVRDKQVMEHTILPKYFLNKCKFMSFVRKLYRWGFRQVERNVSGDTVFMHNSFQRKDKSLCQQMRSVVKKQTATAFIKKAPIGAHGGMMVDPNYAMLMCQQMAMINNNPMLAMTMMSGGGMNPAIMNQSLMGQALNGMNNGIKQNQQQGQGLIMSMGGNSNFNGMNQQPSKHDLAMHEDYQGAKRGNTIPPRLQNDLDFQSNMPPRMMGNNPQIEMIEARLRLEKLEQQQQELEHQRMQAQHLGMFQQDARGGNLGDGLMNSRQPTESNLNFLKAMQTERLHQQSIGNGRGINESLGPRAMNMMQQMGQSHHVTRPAGQDMQRLLIDDRRSHPPIESIGNVGGIRGGFQGIRDGGGSMGAVDDFQRFRMQKQFMMMQGAYMGQQGSPNH